MLADVAGLLLTKLRMFARCLQVRCTVSAESNATGTVTVASGDPYYVLYNASSIKQLIGEFDTIAGCEWLVFGAEVLAVVEINSTAGSVNGSTTPVTHKFDVGAAQTYSALLASFNLVYFSGSNASVAAKDDFYPALSFFIKQAQEAEEKQQRRRRLLAQQPGSSSGAAAAGINATTGRRELQQFVDVNYPYFPYTR